MRLDEVGWSTGVSALCTEELSTLAEPLCEPSEVGEWEPEAPGEYDYGGGGGTTNQYAEPWYQGPVVPAEIAARAGTGELNRVVPDISMEGDPSTGMLVGETQEFADGTYYDQYRIGGTSLSSPLFAGLMADADQAAGGSLGFVNPLLYHLDPEGRIHRRSTTSCRPASRQSSATITSTVKMRQPVFSPRRGSSAWKGQPSISARRRTKKPANAKWNSRKHPSRCLRPQGSTR